MLIYKYLNSAIDISTKIDAKIRKDHLSGIYFANDDRIIKEFVNFKAVG